MKFLKPRFWDNDQISLYSIFLLPVSLLMQIINFVRRLMVKSQKFSIPIICVGNIYLGGTGKTPLCSELFSILKNLNKNAVFIRKKYDSFQDEINLLKQIGPVYEKSKRINALDEAIQNKFEVAILDDGFQDFSIEKDLSIVCFNEKQWIGNGFIIPSGPLREGLSALTRANCVIINGKKNINIENKILKNNKLIKIFYSKYKPQNISDFENRKIICFAGIGNPINFFDLLRKNEINVLEQTSFPDHHNYSKTELDILIKKAKENNATLLTTEKDYLRIEEKYRGNINCLKIKIEIENKNEFIEEIKKII